MTTYDWLRTGMPMICLSACVLGTWSACRIFVQGPGSLVAATPETLTPLPVLDTGPLTPSEDARRAIQHAADLRDRGTTLDLDDFFVVSGRKEAPPLPTGPAPEPEPDVESIPTLQITGIIRTRSGPSVVIRGRLLRTGQSPVDGWVITAIDPDARAITIASEATGRRATLTLD